MFFVPFVPSCEYTPIGVDVGVHDGSDSQGRWSAILSFSLRSKRPYFQYGELSPQCLMMVGLVYPRGNRGGPDCVLTASITAWKTWKGVDWFPSGFESWDSI